MHGRVAPTEGGDPGKGFLEEVRDEQESEK